MIDDEDRERQIAVDSQLATGAGLGGIAISLRKAIAGHKLARGYNVKYDGQIKTLDEQNDASSGALTLLVVPVAGVEKLSFVRLFRRSRQEKPVLVSAGAEEEAALARVVNG